MTSFMVRQLAFGCSVRLFDDLREPEYMVGSFLDQYGVYVLHPLSNKGMPLFYYPNDIVYA